MKVFLFVNMSHYLLLFFDRTRGYKKYIMTSIKTSFVFDCKGLLIYQTNKIKEKFFFSNNIYHVMNHECVKYGILLQLY